MSLLFSRQFGERIKKLLIFLLFILVSGHSDDMAYDTTHQKSPNKEYNEQELAGDALGGDLVTGTNMRAI